MTGMAEGADSKIGVIHYNFPDYSMEDFLSYAEKTGFGYVELQIGDVWNGEEPVSEATVRAQNLKRALDAHGLVVSALAAGNDFVVLDPGEVRSQVERMRKICDLAEILGTKILRMEGGRPKESVPEDRWVEAISTCLTECLDFVEDRDLYLAVDNHGLATNDGDREVAIFEKVGSRHVGANLDTMNYRWFGHDLDAVHTFHKAIAPYALHTHMKDGFGSRETYVCMPLGEGELDLTISIAALKKANYQGVWCVEYEGKEDPAVGYRKGLEYLRGKV
jgi:sugar phosphate isomerase/epimerase